MPRKSPGGARDGFLTARVPERTKFGLKLMSRLYREPAPDLLIRALNNLFSTEHGGLFVDVDGQELPKNLLDWLWADQESDRIANMAFRYPSVMTGPETRAWKLVLADDRFWMPSSAKPVAKGKKADPAKRREEDLRREVLAAEWAALVNDVAVSD